jgi:hypothetical protein
MYRAIKAACVFLLFASLLMAAQKPFGQMAVAGKNIDLLHGAAFEDDERLTLVFTNVAMSPEAGETARMKQWQSGKFIGVEARVYKDESVHSDADLYHPAFRGSAWVTDLNIEITERTAGKVSGKITTEHPGDFFGKRYVVSVAFTLPLLKSVKQ